jgi:hypothetical protein
MGDHLDGVSRRHAAELRRFEMRKRILAKAARRSLALSRGADRFREKAKAKSFLRRGRFRRRKTHGCQHAQEKPRTG